MKPLKEGLDVAGGLGPSGRGGGVGVGLPYRLHQHVVLAIEQPGPGVLVQRLHVLAGAGGKPVLQRTAA